METSEIQEFKVTARIVSDDKEIATVEDVFGVSSRQDEEQEAETKSVDETVNQFVNKVHESAQEKGYTISQEDLAKTAVSLILFIVKPSQPELALDIPAEKSKQEEKNDVS